MFNQPRVHWALLDKKGCINCHSPHGSANDSLLKEPMLFVCASCHADTVARQERAVTQHPPCGECHEWQAHSTHPIGDDVVDPRNANITVQCSSCHRSHGTEYKHFIYYQNKDDLCVQCHVDYRR